MYLVLHLRSCPPGLAAWVNHTKDFMGSITVVCRIFVRGWIGFCVREGLGKPCPKFLRTAFGVLHMVFIRTLDGSS